MKHIDKEGWDEEIEQYNQLNAKQIPKGSHYCITINNPKLIQTRFCIALL